MKDIEDQIAELNNEVKARLAPSAISGVGVFAMRDIKKGERVYCKPREFKKWYSIPYGRLNELRPEVKGLILERWASIINGSEFQSPNDDAWLVLFINHSDYPNYDVTTDSALRDVRRGEELTENYRRMVNAEKVYPFLTKRSLLKKVKVE